MSGLIFGPPDAEAWHLCIDMQRIFLEPGDWYCPDGLEILPAIRRLASHAPERSAFTRFITPATPEEAEGRWQHFYRHWSGVTRTALGDEVLELHAELLPLAAPERILDKATHNAFDSAAFESFVAGIRPSALILTGGETDVCVLATALSAVDRGVRVIVVGDAVASSDRASHRACLDLVYPRYDQQIEQATCAELLASGWPS